MKKLWKMLAIAALVLLTTAMLWGCSKTQPEVATEAPTEAPTEALTEAPAESDNVIIAWNVDASYYRGKPGEVSFRHKDDEGYYSFTFAFGGKQERLRVTEATYKKGIDMQEVVCLQIGRAHV